jgi:hypothetical protein
MKKTLTTLAVIGMCAAAPAFAGNHATTQTTTTTSYRTVQVRPMTVEQRRALQTKIERHVKRLDLNQDRRVSQDEFVSYKTQHTQGNFSLDAAQQQFKNTDTNNDGSVSSQEIMDAKTRYITKHSMAMDMASDNGDAYYHERRMRKSKY